MENEDRPLSRFVDFCWAACQEYGRFVWVSYGGEAVPGPEEPIQRAYRDVPEKVR
jgi:hypothetical protein